MKVFLTAAVFILAFVSGIFAQKPEKFDIVSYNAPNGWQKTGNSDAIVFTTADKAKNVYCAITLFRAFASKGDSKKNFNVAWDTLIADSFKLLSAPQMSASANDNGWAIESGVAAFEKDGSKGMLMLITASGGGKMVNVLVLTNTDAYQNQVSAFVESMNLPAVAANQTPIQAQTQNRMQTQTQVNPASTNSSGISKSTTIFSDGWTATIQPNYVSVTKNDFRIFLCYSIKVPSFSGYQDEVDYFWQTYVQSMFKVTSKTINPTRPYVSLGYGEGNAVDKAMGQPVYVVMIVLIANGVYTPVIAAAPGKQTYYAHFPRPENLGAMVNSNRFAVAQSDVVGNWDGGANASALLENIYTGQNAGMTATSISDRFAFGANGTYTSEHKAATGMVGSQKFYSGKFIGRFQASDWEVTLTNRENGKTSIFSAYFEAVKGGKILHLTDKQYSGMQYHLFKTN